MSNEQATICEISSGTHSKFQVRAPILKGVYQVNIITFFAQIVGISVFRKLSYSFENNFALWVSL